MSTLQTTDRTAPSLRVTLTATLAMIGVLVAIAIAAVIVTAGDTSHVSQPVSVVTNADPSTAYGPHDYGTTSRPPVRSAVRVTPNNQTSAAYTKAGLNIAAR
jgi:hypothetical protein